MSTQALFVASLTQASDGDGLTFSEIIDSLPTDPASMVVMILLAGFFGVVLYFGVKRSGDGANQGGSEDQESREEDPNPPKERAGKQGT
jgi:hypothetical protein